jgi:hypothetical protein
MLQIIAGIFRGISEKILGLFRKKVRTDKELAELLEVYHKFIPECSLISCLICSMLMNKSISTEEYLRLHAMYKSALNGKVNVLHYFNQPLSLDQHAHEFQREYCGRFIGRMIYIETMKELGYAYE